MPLLIESPSARAGEGPIQRKRGFYLVLVYLVLLLGLATRWSGLPWPAWVVAYAGDGLYALMVFLGLGFLFPRAGTLVLGAACLAFCYGVEVSQLHHAPWIDGIRATRLGGLVLGYGFLWADLLCYTVGTAVGVAGELVAAVLKRGGR